MQDKHTQKLVITSLTFTLLAGLTLAGLVMAKNDKTGQTPPAPAALTVETNFISLQESFSMERTFSGQVQARRQSELGFESAGRLSRVWVDEGTRVEAGELLAELDTDRLIAQRNELTAARAEAEANLSLAKITFRRLSDIADKGGVSPQDLDESREALRAAKAALSLADQRITSIDIELEKTRLVAPFDATVIARLADEGRVLEAGYPVLTLQENAIPEIRIGIAGRSLDQLKPGKDYKAIWRGRTLWVHLRALLPIRATSARTVDALFDPIDPPPEMLPGDIVSLTLESPIRQRGGWLPISAIAEDDRGLWSVCVAEPLATPDTELAATHRIERRTVDVIHQSGHRVFVKGALTPNQLIVMNGMHRIVPGQAVRLEQKSISRVEAERD